MPSRPLDHETKSMRWPVGLAGIEKIRIPPVVESVFKQWRSSFTGKAEFVQEAVLKSGLIALIVAGRLDDCYRTLGLLLGYDVTTVPVVGAGPADGTSVPPGDKRPLHRAGGRINGLRRADAAIRRTDGAIARAVVERAAEARR